MLTAQQLADALRAQATSDGTISVNDALLGITGLDALVRSDLQRTDGTILLDVAPSAIPASPPAAGFTITAAAVPDASSGFLELDGRAASIAFAFGTTIDVTLTVETQQLASGAPVDWTLGTSFPEVAYQGYDQLVMKSSQLVLATTAPTGLALSSTLTPAAVLEAAATLLNLTTSFPLTGTIVRDAKGNLSFQLEADLGIPTFGIQNVITLEKPRIVVNYAETAGDDGTTQTFVEIAIAATISAGSSTTTGAADGKVVLDVSIGMPISTNDSPVIQLAVTPKGFTASLLSLGSLVAGQTWDDFFKGPAAPLAPYFSTFGFIGYTMTFSTSAKVVSLTLRVGTLQPWPLWGKYTLQLDGTWDVTFLNPGTVQTLLLHAGFNYDDRMQFDVDVYLPNLRITGRQSGDPLVFSLADVSKKLFDGALSVPDDLLTVKVSGFWIDINKPASTLGIGATANASVSLFGTQLLAVHDMAISVTVDDSDPKKRIYSATLDGQISLGPITAQVDAVLSNDPAVGCTFTVHLVNETVGSMLGHLVHLVDPTYDVNFGAPWDTFLDISLDALVLKVDVTNSKVEIDYVQTIDLGFLTITELGLAWQKNKTGPSTTKITISGTFLGVPIGGDSGRPPLSWDPVNENPPSVPGGGDKLLDLRYVGIGQHVGFDPSWQPANVEAVITKMEQLALPAGGSNIPNLTSPGGLQFRSDSGWLVGADFTILGTVQLALVFNDPSLYGLLIALSGPRAKSFGGLKFEILYRKITDTIGVYHIELKLPDAMRHLEFGEVSVTLPQVILDIYTNGNFRIDFGFPVGLDFSNSFCLQVFPFVGYGGFYFALLNGDTSTRVPKITNGTFNPVIEFGIALSVGVGKTIDEGILSGGISVVVIGIIEGVIGWFNPTDAAVPKEEYYWLQGTISIVGRLYATIDFVIVQASLSVTAYASVTLVIEAHQPILISMSVGVSVEVSVKIVFFTIHCSFSATVSASFTIGSASPTPWTVASGGGTRQLQLFAQRGVGLHAPQRRMFADNLRVTNRALLQNRLAAGDVTLDWTVRTVFGTPCPIAVSVMPAFTQANGGVAGILLLGMSDGIAARASSLRAHQLRAADNSGTGIGNVLEGLVRWAVLNARATLGETDATLVSQADVTLLGQAFADDDTLAAAVDYTTNLSPFLAANYRLTLTPPPSQSNGGDSGVAAFPMPPVLTMTAGTATPVDFGQVNGLDETTQEKMRAYFELLAVDYEKFVAQSGSDDGVKAMAFDPAKTPAAQVIFEQYFAMLMRSAVKAAGDVMQRYPFSFDDATKTFGVAEVRTALGDSGLPALDVISPNRASTTLLATGATVTLDGTQHQVANGDSFASVAATFNAVLPSNAQITATGIAEQNLGAPGLLASGVSVPFNGLQWTTLANESLDLIAARLLTRAAGNSFVQQLPGVQQAAQALLVANPTIFPKLDPIVALRTPIDAGTVLSTPGGPFSSYTAVANDTFIAIAAATIALNGSFVDASSFVAWVLANNTLSVTDPTAAQPVGTTLNLPSTAHAIQSGESIADLAVVMLTTQAVAIASLLAVPSATNLLAAQAMMDMPPLTYATRAGDSFNSIAALFNLTLDGLAAALDSSQTEIFAAGVQIVVADADQMTIDRLVAALAATQWPTVGPMASRFILSGLRLPDPNDAAFEKLTLDEMKDPRVLGAIQTLPMYVQTGQQFAISATPPAGYTISLAPDSGAPAWIANTSAVSFPLSADQLTTITKIAGATFAPTVELNALPLFRLAPTRYTLQTHVSWQPAYLPAGAVYAAAAAGSVTGNPDIWMFPDALVSQLQADGASQPPYTVSIGTHETAQSGMNVANARAFAWATSLSVAVQQLPADDAEAATAATIVTLVGVDDAGLLVLDAVLKQLENDDATLFLLYSPNPSTPATGLFSDQMEAATALVQTNLSTLSNSGASMPKAKRASALLDSATGNPTYVAPLTDAAAFLQMLWECSIVRSGGYYLRYAPSGGGALPPTLFSSGPTASFTLLIVLDSQNAAHPPMLPFNTCAVVGDNIDAATSNVFVQPATWLVSQPSSLTDASTYAKQTFGLTLSASDVATLNADVPQLLRPGAVVQVAGGTDTVRIDDSLTTLATRNKLTPATLATFGTNAAATILVPTGLVQFTADALTRTSAFAAGNAGFQLTRPNPDPGNQQALTAMDGDTIVDELYNMLAQRIMPNAKGDACFLRSGEGIPIGPAQSVPTENGANAPSNTANDQWDYHHAVAIAPFALTAYGSASPALPPAAQNPYAGVGPTASVTFAFAFADPFGNELAAPSNAQTLVQDVRYFDELAGIARWPSAACAYELSGDGKTDPTIVLSLTMQLDKYAVSPTMSAERAARNTATDLVTYERAYYQLSQPDVGFALTTTLEAPVRGLPVNHILDPQTFLTFVTSAWVALDALTGTSAATTIAGSNTTIGSIATTYDVALGDVFTVNGTQLYSALFGTNALAIPVLYTTVAGDSLASIANGQSIGQPLLVQQNPWAALDPANDLVAPARTVQPKSTDSLSSIAAALQCSVSGIASSNSGASLTDGLPIAVAGVTVVTKGDTFATLVTKFTAVNVAVTIGGIAVANQTIPGIFVTPVTLTIEDVVPLRTDSLGSLQQRFGFSMATLAEANASLANLFAAGTSLYIGAGADAPVPPAGTTLAQFASNERIPIDGLGRALWNGLQPASPAAVNAGVVLATGAKVELPATIVNGGTDRHATYAAQSTDTDIATIAAKFAGNDPGQLGTLSVDLPGLFQSGTNVVDKASGTSIPTTDESTFASLVIAFAGKGYTVTAASLASDNATTANLVKEGGVWITPPMIAIPASGSAGDTLTRIAARYGTDVSTVARLNAGVLGLIVAGVALPAVNGISHTTVANDTLNSLIGVFTPPGGAAVPIDVLATAFADVAFITPNALILPSPLSAGASVQVSASFADPIVPLGVTVVESRDPDWVDVDFKTTPDVGSTTFAVPAQTVGQESATDPNVLSLDAFATIVETALPGVRVATGDAADVNDDPSQRTLWLVNFSNSRGPTVGFTFEGAAAVRSFAIPPLSTALASGTVAVTPYVSGTGLSGSPQSIVFAGIDLDTWGAAFLEAVDLSLTPVFAVPMQEAALADFDTIVNAKRTLATSISGCVQYVLDGGGPGEFGGTDPRRAAAIEAMKQSLLVTLSNAYTIESVVQAAVDVAAPYTDPVVAPRISGKAVLTQPATQGQPVKNASLSTAKVPLAGTKAGSPATASFLLTVQAPATDRSITATIGYAVAEIERPVGPPDVNGYQVSTWLTLVHPLESTSSTIEDVSLPIPLRAYPAPTTAISQQGRRSVEQPKTVDDLVRWDASATWQHNDADQDQIALRMEVGNAPPSLRGMMAGAPSTDALFAALGQFMTVWPAVQTDLALFTALLPGAKPSSAATGALSALATMADAVAAAWPTNAIVPPKTVRSALVESDEIVPGTYDYVLTRPMDQNPDLTTLTVDAPSTNPAVLWPALSVDDGSGAGMRPLTLTSSSSSQAVYTYPAGIAKGQSLRYEAAVLKADVVMIPDFDVSTSVTRNADLVTGTDTCPLFIYRTPYTSFSSPLIPLLQIDEDFDIGSGTTAQLEAALQTFLESLLSRAAAPSGSQRTLRVAASYGYRLTLPPGNGAARSVRGVRSALASPDGLVPRLPISLVPAVELTINGDDDKSIDAFATDLAGFIVTWDGQVQPSHVNASLFFEISLFSANAGSQDKPLLIARSIRYAL